MRAHRSSRAARSCPAEACAPRRRASCGASHKPRRPAPGKTRHPQGVRAARRLIRLVRRRPRRRRARACLSAAAQGQVTNGAVDLVAFVAQEQCDKLREEVDDAAQELAALDDWRDRLKLAISKRLELSKPFHAHRAQAMGLMVTPLARDDGAVPPADPPPAFHVLHRLVDELARATVVSHEELDVPEWRLRRAAAGVAYALCEVRALTDDSEDLGKSLKVAAEVVDRFGDASEGPAALKQGLKAGAHAAASLGTAALSFLPGPAVGALPQLLDVFASRLSGGLGVPKPRRSARPGAARVAGAGAAGRAAPRSRSWSRRPVARAVYSYTFTHSYVRCRCWIGRRQLGHSVTRAAHCSQVIL